MDNVTTTIIRARLRRWGHTYGLRVSPKEVARLGTREGAELTAVLSTSVGRVRMDDLAVIDDLSEVAAKHDLYLGEALGQEARRWRRRRRA